VDLITKLKQPEGWKIEFECSEPEFRNCFIIKDYKAQQELQQEKQQK
jgi:hypothetical protein